MKRISIILFSVAIISVNCAGTQAGGYFTGLNELSSVQTGSGLFSGIEPIIYGNDHVYAVSMDADAVDANIHVVDVGRKNYDTFRRVRVVLPQEDGTALYSPVIISFRSEKDEYGNVRLYLAGITPAPNHPSIVPRLGTADQAFTEERVYTEEQIILEGGQRGSVDHP